jgi:hypothetical protein
MSPEVLKLYLKFKSNIKLLELKSENLNAFIFKHKNADIYGLKENVEVAHTLSENGFSILINEHVFDVSKKKNPEYTIIYPDGRFFTSDLKTPNPQQYTTLETSIKNSFSSARKQKARHAVIRIIDNEAETRRICEGINAGFLKERKHQEVIVVRKKIAVSISRKDYDDQKVSDRVAELF